MKNFKKLYKTRRTRAFIPDKDGDYTEVKNADRDIVLSKYDASKHKDCSRYRKNTEGIPDTLIAGTALAFTATLWQCSLTTPLLWVWFKGMITDGYWMISLSPLILLYWIIVSALYAPVAILLGGLVALAAIWTVVVEMPAAFMNNEEVFPFGTLVENDEDA